ncbi:hypothetical protein BD779DRAFT_1476676 [Infundibulicybe gibba]|nr:hypothetical protein BD779DRAFT_1476676 [Infundibulicybe gibba]
MKASGVTLDHQRIPNTHRYAREAEWIPPRPGHARSAYLAPIMLKFSVVILSTPRSKPARMRIGAGGRPSGLLGLTEDWAGRDAGMNLSRLDWRTSSTPTAMPDLGLGAARAINALRVLD